MVCFSVACAVVVGAVWSTIVGNADAHGYLTCPAPRQLRDEKVETWTNWVGIAVPGDLSFSPGQGNAPNMNAGIVAGSAGATVEASEGHGLCGDKASRSGFTVSPYGPTTPRGTYVAGGTMDVRVVITAYHAGWFEFRLCVPADGGADTSIPLTQECLNEHVLEVDESTPYYPTVVDYANLRGLNGDGGGYKCPVSAGYTDPTATSANTVWPSGTCCNNGGACSDPTNNKDRYIMESVRAGGGLFHITLKVPSGIECERCTLQWLYQTANSYDMYPEMFYNCADIKILAEGSTADTGCDVPGPPVPITGVDSSGGGNTRVTFFCSTTPDEYGNGNVAECIECLGDDDCPSGKSCWGFTYCMVGVLCGSTGCPSSASYGPVTDMPCSYSSSCTDFQLTCNSWCGGSNFSTQCNVVDSAYPDGTYRHFCTCSPSNAQGVCTYTTPTASPSINYSPSSSVTATPSVSATPLTLSSSPTPLSQSASASVSPDPGACQCYNCGLFTSGVCKHLNDGSCMYTIGGSCPAGTRSCCGDTPTPTPTPTSVTCSPTETPSASTSRSATKSPSSSSSVSATTSATPSMSLSSSPTQSASSSPSVSPSSSAVPWANVCGDAPAISLKILGTASTGGTVCLL